MSSRSIFTCLMVLFLTSCGPSEEEKAAFRLKTIRTMLEQRDTTKALLHLDSVALLYPKAAYSVNAAKNLKREILWEILRQKEAELDSARARITLLEKNFVFGKNEFQRFAGYTHRKQVAGDKLSRSYLKAEVNEKGDLALISQYYGGQRLQHTTVKVVDGSTEAATEPVAEGNVDHYQSSFLGERWERVTFRDGRDNGIAEFIAGRSGNKLKVVLAGKGSFTYFLEDSDKKAIREAFDLAAAIKIRQRLESEILRLQVR